MPTKKPETDAVNRPGHYQGSGMEAIDVVEAFQLPTHVATAVIYLLRAGKKDPKEEVQDIKKAIWWLVRHLKHSFGVYLHTFWEETGQGRKIHINED